MRRELAEWRDPHTGIAALSFTNVASHEIREALGADPPHPHFVGTIDSFVYRYIVRPFARLFDPLMSTPRLVPADATLNLQKDQHWHAGSLQVKISERHYVNLYQIHFRAKQAGQAVLVASRPGSAPTVLLPETAEQVLAAKRSAWRRSGRLSHSDCAYVGAQILSDPDNGAWVREMLLRRFGLLVVDELQDTGYYLSSIIMSLVRQPACRALLVGDPNQAIYEFNGASPALFCRFESLPDSEQLPISASRRCPSRVCAVATSLSAADEAIQAMRDAKGVVVMTVYRDQQPDLRGLWQALHQAQPSGVHRIITRGNAAVVRLLGGNTDNDPAFGSPPLRMMHRAVNYLRAGRTRRALAAAGAALARPLLGTDAPVDEDLVSRGIDLHGWRSCVVSTLMALNQEIDGEDLYAWGMRARDAIVAALAAVLPSGHDGDTPSVPRRPASALQGIPRSDHLILAPQRLERGREFAVQTVHGVKGETHDTTILYVPRPRTASQCPSNLWWRGSGDSEERRIAFVAATRPRSTFVLCVHTETHARLASAQSGFVGLFEVMGLDDLTTQLLDGQSACGTT